MEIIACVGLAQNFAALRSLTTVGIQAGHMKMHLTNILAGMKATDEEIEKAKTTISETREALVKQAQKTYIIDQTATEENNKT